MMLKISSFLGSVHNDIHSSKLHDRAVSMHTSRKGLLIMSYIGCNVLLTGLGNIHRARLNSKLSMKIKTSMFLGLNTRKQSGYKQSSAIRAARPMLESLNHYSP